MPLGFSIPVGRILVLALVSACVGSLSASAQDQTGSFQLAVLTDTIAAESTPAGSPTEEPSAAEPTGTPGEISKPAPLSPEGESRHVNVRRDPTGEIHITLSLTTKAGTSVKAWRATSLPDLKANQPEGYEVFVEFLKGEVAARARQRALMKALMEKANAGHDGGDIKEGDLELAEGAEGEDRLEKIAARPALAEKAARLPMPLILPQSSAAWPSQEAQPRQIMSDIGGGRIMIRDAADGMISISWRPLSENKGQERNWMGNSIDRLKSCDPQLAEWYEKLTGGAMSAQDLAKAPLSDSGMSVIGLLPPPPPPPAPEDGPVPVTEVGGLPLAPVPIVPVAPFPIP